MQTVFIFIIAYLAGSIPFGKIVGRIHGIDIQKKGSGNIGFANVCRVLGWRAGIIVLAGDILKGFMPVLLAKHYLSPDQSLLVLVLAIAGHLFPVWLHFKGGKGIATGLGGTLAINPLLGTLGLCIYITVVVGLRKSAPASLAGAWSLPVFCLLITHKYVLFYVGLALLAAWTHRTNIRKMIKEKSLR